MGLPIREQEIFIETANHGPVDHHDCRRGQLRRLAILYARPIARLIHLALWPRPKVVHQPGPEAAREVPAVVIAPRG